MECQPQDTKYPLTLEMYERKLIILEYNDEEMVGIAMMLSKIEYTICKEIIEKNYNTKVERINFLYYADDNYSDFDTDIGASMIYEAMYPMKSIERKEYRWISYASFNNVFFFILEKV